MKRIIISSGLFLNVFACSMALAKEPVNKFLPLLKLPPGSITKEKATALLGNPIEVEETKKGISWRYERDNSKLTIRWKKGEPCAERISFSCTKQPVCAYDYGLEHKFQEGALDINQAVTELGAPKEMLVKKVTQVLHYQYQNNMLRLFFRNKVLVDYTLTEKGSDRSL